MRLSPIAFLSFAALLPVAVKSGDVGILYEVWHTLASTAQREVAAAGFPLLTTELVIQSQSGPSPLSLGDVYGRVANVSGDIYNAQPALGFYCLYRARPGEANPPAPDCPNISATAAAHAALLVGAGIDYVAIDVTNWPVADFGGSTDVAVLRPTEVLFEEWAALRSRGIPTPQIAIWPCSPAGGTTWQYLLNVTYNNASYADLVYAQNGSKVVFLPYTGSNCYDEGVVAEMRANGGRNDVTTIPMWALIGPQVSAEGVWGFFSPCTDEGGSVFTTSMVGVGPCNQRPTTRNGSSGDVVEISASGGYMTSQCALPFASPGHLRGLTVARLFEQILAARPPHVFMSSFNEYIGGRQAPAYPCKIAINMGLPDDAQRSVVWVDTYAAEFSRDIEPSVEGGNRTWLVAAACIGLYKAGQDCADAPESLCCTREDKEVYANEWAMARIDGSDFLITQLASERAALIAGGAWKETCSPINNPTAFCVDPSDLDGRAGPFITFNTSAPSDYVNGGVIATTALYRCIDAGLHFFSADPACEGATTESILGYMQQAPGNEMLRALRRCRGAAPGTRFHALDLPCDTPDGDGHVFGYVR